MTLSITIHFKDAYELDLVRRAEDLLIDPREFGYSSWSHGFNNTVFCFKSVRPVDEVVAAFTKEFPGSIEAWSIAIKN